MKIPYQLWWQPTSAPTSALLIPGQDAEIVLRVCVELGLDPLPAIYPVADGFVLHLPTPMDRCVAGAVRLRGLSAHLLLPANAELVPALLPDEASALVRKRGLVFLPGGRVLEYDPAQPIPPATLVRIDDARRRPWQAFPEPPTLANDVTEITLQDFDGSPEQLLEPGGAGIATHDPTLQGGGLAAQLLGNALFGLGKGLAKLGQSVNSQALAGLAARFLGGAMSLLPALSAKLMGEQEAKLRALLRQFRDGNIDQALQRALPLDGNLLRGMVPAQNAGLPTHSLFYSLVNLLGSNAGGAVSMWFTPDNTYYELMREYRKQADLAVSRGDFRRAAFIYAKLLNDFSSAARVLAQGGLHRDAAILYEKKLDDLASAAREWQAAGEYDRALDLFRKMGDHLSAGDLLRRIGEEDLAVREFQIAAAQLVESGPNHYEAGELLRVRAERPDLALDYYEKGWRLRRDGSALLCATRIAQQHASAGSIDPFLTLIDEADTYLAERDPESTANFFTEITRLAGTKSLAPIADAVRDRALMGIAKKMKQSLIRSSGSSGVLAGLLKNPSVWPVPLVTDAQFALTEAGKRAHAPKAATYPTVRAGKSPVTAVCSMPLNGQVFLGFENGEVACFEPMSSAVHLLTRESGPILSLSIDASMSYLLILSMMGPDKVCLRVISRRIGYRMLDYYWLDVTAPARLAIPAINSNADFAILCHGREYRKFSLPNLVGSGGDTFGASEATPEAVLFGTVDAKSATPWMLAFYDRRAELLTSDTGPLRPQSYTPIWTPGASASSSLRQIPLQAVQLNASGMVEIAGLDAHGSLHRSTLNLRNIAVKTVTHHPIGSDRYQAFACMRSDLTAGIHVKGIDWWTPGRTRPAQTRAALANPVAAFPLSDTREILIVDADGTLTRVPPPE